MSKVTEQEVAAPIVAWLQDLKWDVYQEVLMAGSIADIVAVQNKVVWIVETKTTLSMAVLAQAHRWLRFANYSSVGTPMVRDSSGRWFAEHVMKDYGIGWLTAAGKECCKRLDPRFIRNTFYGNTVSTWKEWAKRLHEAQKSYCKAGAHLGGYWTPFKGTCGELREHVKKNPGCTLKEAITEIKTHYRTVHTAMNSLRVLIEQGVVEGVELRREGKKLFLHPTRGEGNEEDS